MMAIEKIEDAEAVSNSLPKRNPDVKPKSKGAPSSLKGKERGEKKNTPKKSFRGSELNFNQVKVSSQPMEDNINDE